MSSLLETERLRLEHWTADAVEELLSLHGNADVQRYLDARGETWSREKAARRLGEWQTEWRELGLGKHRLVRRSDGVFVGRAGFSQFGDTPEIGYSLARNWWGQGYATEIAQALSNWFFATRHEDRFVGFTHTGNLASIAVMRKIGMEPTHVAEIAGMPHQFLIQRRPS